MSHGLATLGRCTALSMGRPAPRALPLSGLGSKGYATELWPSPTDHRGAVTSRGHCGGARPTDDGFANGRDCATPGTLTRQCDARALSRRLHSPHHAAPMAVTGGWGAVAAVVRAVRKRLEGDGGDGQRRPWPGLMGMAVRSPRTPPAPSGRGLRIADPGHTSRAMRERQAPPSRATDRQRTTSPKAPRGQRLGGGGGGCQCLASGALEAPSTCIRRRDHQNA